MRNRQNLEAMLKELLKFARKNGIKVQMSIKLLTTKEFSGAISYVKQLIEKES